MTAALAQSTGELAALDPNDPGRTRVLQDQGEPTAGVQGRLHAAGNDGHAGRPVQSLPPSTKYPRAHRSGCKAVIRVYIVNSTFGGASGQGNNCSNGGTVRPTPNPELVGAPLRIRRGSKARDPAECQVRL
jgi:hypothetical protein